MSRRGARGADVVVVGGGVVGAACALALARQHLAVTLVDAAEPLRWSPLPVLPAAVVPAAVRPHTAAPAAGAASSTSASASASASAVATAPPPATPAASGDLRVYAVAPDSAALLQSVGAWDAIAAARAQPYRRMRVWDAGSGGELRFDADALGRRSLGWIVEHALLVDRLWAALPAAGVDVRTPATVQALDQSEEGVTLRLDDGSRIDGALAIAADGANSALRRLCGVGTAHRDYGQRGVVAYIATERRHEDTAWQRFLPTGPIALLPFVDGHSSIVWTLPTAQAEAMLALDDAAFAREVTLASAARLGAVTAVSARAAFGLRRQLVDRQIAGRVLLLGDAAHVVHPLAGQGVNLGLRDVAALVETLAASRARGRAWDSPHALRRWARARRSENAVATYALEAINAAYSNDAPLPSLVRGHLLGLAGRLPPVSEALWRKAAGI